MQNILLVGLSRQVALERELAVVANNIANINTTGFKSDGALFEEYIGKKARSGNLSQRDSKVSFVRDRATWVDMSQGAMQRTGNPTRCRDRRQRLPGDPDAERRTLHAQRRLADQSAGPTGDHRRLSGPRR